MQTQLFCQTAKDDFDMLTCDTCGKESHRDDYDCLRADKDKLFCPICGSHTTYKSREEMNQP